jgi:beta-fructofuranosidase
MWECPDFFTIGDKDIFTCSPIGTGDRTCSYFMGKLDYQSGVFQLDRSGEIDWGFDHYAAQTFEDSHGRRLMLSWANGWDWMPWWRDWGPTYKEGWCGSFTIPKEVAIAEDGELSFTPASELSEHLQPAESASVISCGGGQTCPIASINTSGRLTLHLSTSGNTAPKVTLRLQHDVQHYVLLVVDFGRRDITVDRKTSDGWSTGTMHTVLKSSVVGELDVDIIFDTSSLEIFTQGHRTNFSFNVFGGGPWKVSVASDTSSIQIRDISAWNYQEHSIQSNRQEIEA